MKPTEAPRQALEQPPFRPAETVLPPFVHLRTFLSLSAVALGLGGCTTTAALQLAGTAVGGAMNAILDAAGLQTTGTQALSFTIASGDALNATASGQSHSVVVRLFQLRAQTAFDAMTPLEAGNDDQLRAILGDDLIRMRELTVLPGKDHHLDEPIDPDARFIGFAALFHAPAASRWKAVIGRSDIHRSAVSIVLGACSLQLVHARNRSPEAGPAIDRPCSQIAGGR